VERGIEDRHMRNAVEYLHAASIPVRLAGLCSGASGAVLARIASSTARV